MNKVLFRAFLEAPANAWPQELDLLTRHDLYFETRAAETPELVDMAHAVRYQVYCLERKFESAEQHALATAFIVRTNRIATVSTIVSVLR